MKCRIGMIFTVSKLLPTRSRLVDYTFMRKTLPILFMLFLVAGAFTIGFAMSWFWQKQSRNVLLATQDELRLSKESLKTKSVKLKNAKAAERLSAQSVERLNSDLAGLRTALESQKSELDTKSKANIALVEEKQSLESEIKKIRGSTTDLKASSEALKLETQKMKSEIEALKNKLAIATKDLTDRKSETDAALAESAASIKELELRVKILTDDATKHETNLQISSDEKDILYAEVERYSSQSKAAIEALGKDVGGLDVLLTPEFKSNFAEFLSDIGID